MLFVVYTLITYFIVPSLIQVEEFKKAEEEGRKRGLKYRLLDTTQATLLRPDGHPGRYGHRVDENVTLYNDCVHWCLPGPIDTWSDFLLEMLKTEGRRSHQEKFLYSNNRLKVKQMGSLDDGIEGVIDFFYFLMIILQKKKNAYVFIEMKFVMFYFSRYIFQFYKCLCLLLLLLDRIFFVLLCCPI